MPLKESSAAVRATATPAAFRPWQEHSTSPPSRIAHKTKKIHKNRSCCMETLIRCSAHKFHSCGGRHGRSNSHLSLTTAYSACNSSISHSKIADGACIKKCIDDFPVLQVIFFLKSQKETWDSRQKNRLLERQQLVPWLYLFQEQP